jgi:hypothetical protein
MVKMLDTLTFTRSVTRSAESVSFCTYIFVKEKFGEYHGSIKPYNVDRLGKGWTVLVGKELGLTDVQ